MDTYQRDCGEVAEERGASESDTLSGGHEDEEDREANESAALSKGRGDEEREVRESAALSEGFKDGHEDEEEREASESTTLNEGCGTQDDFLEAVKEAESAGLCRGTRAHVEFPCVGSLLGLIMVMGDWGLTLQQQRGAFIQCITTISCLHMLLGPQTLKSW